MATITVADAGLRRDHVAVTFVVRTDSGHRVRATARIPRQQARGLGRLALLRLAWQQVLPSVRAKRALLDATPPPAVRPTIPRLDEQVGQTFTPPTGAEP